MNEYMQCPKCRGAMRTYNRSGISIEQCDNCRGVFLDYGELEAVMRVEQQYHAAPPPPPPPAYGGQPGWGAHGHYGHHQRPHSFMRMLFSS